MVNDGLKTLHSHCASTAEVHSGSQVLGCTRQIKASKTSSFVRGVHAALVSLLPVSCRRFKFFLADSVTERQQLALNQLAEFTSLKPRHRQCAMSISRCWLEPIFFAAAWEGLRRTKNAVQLLNH